MSQLSLTRRETVLALLSGAATAAAAPAFAQQAEWLQNYDAGPRNSVLRSSTPMLSPETLQATEQAIVAYRDLAARGGWQPVQLPDRLGLGARGPAVAALRQRLAITGDLVQKAGESNVYDSYVEAAVRQFQARVGLSTTGAINRATIIALNVPIERRIRQLETNVVRLRTWSGNLGNRYVVANIPAAMVETVENGHVAGVEFEETAEREGRLIGTGATFTLPADMVFKAIGQTLVPAALNSSAAAIVLEGGKIRVDDERRTSLPGVWAGGDCAATGEDLTVAAVADGRIAAESIHRALSA